MNMKIKFEPPFSVSTERNISSELSRTDEFNAPEK